MSPIRFPWPLLGGAAATAAQILADLRSTRTQGEQLLELVRATNVEVRHARQEMRAELTAMREQIEPLLQLERRVSHLEAVLIPGRDLRLTPDADEATRYGIPPRAPSTLPEKPG